MLELCLLGTGGMMPLPKRWLTSLMLRCNGSSLLIDCGEGTQIAMREKGWSPYSIDTICFTHYHADHISGLPGMLLSMGNAERTKPVTMIGPKGLARVVNGLRSIAPELPFAIEYIEIQEEEQRFSCESFQVEAFKVQHSIPCFGYKIIIPRSGKFSVERAREAGIPVSCWNRLQHGEAVEHEGSLFTPDMVMGEARRGISVVYCTDTRPIPRIAEKAKDVDLFICEGMYGEEDKLSNAKKHKHMTMEEAAILAREARPREMWLPHYSPSEVYPEQYKDKFSHIFPVKFARDAWSKDISFEEEEEGK